MQRKNNCELRSQMLVAAFINHSNDKLLQLLYLLQIAADESFALKYLLQIAALDGKYSVPHI